MQYQFELFKLHVGMGLLEGKSWAESVNILKKKFLTVYMVSEQ